MSDQPGCPCSICDEDYMNQSESRDSAGQSADLRTRIAAVLGDCYEKYGVDDYNLMADAVIRELEADYILVPKGHTVARWIPEGIFDERT